MAKVSIINGNKQAPKMNTKLQAISLDWESSDESVSEIKPDSSQSSEEKVLLKYSPDSESDHSDEDITIKEDLPEEESVLGIQKKIEPSKKKYEMVHDSFDTLKSRSSDSSDEELPDLKYTSQVRHSSDDEIGDYFEKIHSLKVDKVLKRDGNKNLKTKQNLKCDASNKTVKTIKNKKNKRDESKSNEKKMMLAEKREITNKAFRKRIIVSELQDYSKYMCGDNGCKFETIYKHKAEKHATGHDKKRKVKKKKSNKHTCTKCEHEFDSKSGINKHWKEVHAQNEVSLCTLCGKEFQSKSHLSRHLKSVHIQDKSSPCHMCNKLFKNNYLLKDHIKRMHGVNVFECDHCDKRFAAKHLLNLHTKAVHEKQFLCTCCGQNWSDSSHLKRHMKSQSKLSKEKKAFKCSFCNKEFVNITNLNRHINLHNNVKPFKCDVCDKDFSSEYDMRRHIKIHSRDKNSPNNASPINYVNISDYELVDESLSEDLDNDRTEVKLDNQSNKDTFVRDVEPHIINKDNNKSPSANVQFKNNNEFVNVDKRKVNNLVHVGGNVDNGEMNQIEIDGYQIDNEYDQVCKICKKIFSSSKYLIRHMTNVHSDTTENDEIILSFPHKCNVCGKGFSTKFNLKKHSKLHDVENVKCDKCMVTFLNKALFYEHRPCKLKCSGCDYATTKPLSLSNHVRRKHARSG